ncbi:helix-turn-helix domain-containing protein [Exilibacterium tricleocarpae]|nr:helix-turn-helix domain-containing protein [Exilibacterium tricleocarpae]
MTDYLLTPYVIPSATALLLKVAVLWIARRSFRQISLWLWATMVALVGLNIFEITSFLYVDRPTDGVFYMSLYYFFGVVAALSILGLALEVTDCPNNVGVAIVVVMAIPCVVAIFTPGAAFVGARSIGYSVTRIPGDFYWVLQITLFVAAMTPIVLLIRFISTTANWYAKRRAMVMLLATGPVALVALGLLLAMQIGYAVNGAVFMSLAVNIMLVVLFLTESIVNTEKVLRILSLIPATQEYRAVNHIKDAMLASDTTGLKMASATFERIYIKEAIERCGGNKTKAAQALGIGRATLIRKMKEEES